MRAAYVHTFGDLVPAFSRAPQPSQDAVGMAVDEHPCDVGFVFGDLSMGGIFTESSRMNADT